MAKIQFGAIVSDARKKIGGIVFSKSRSGAFIRKKVSPVQPRTSDVRAVRANFTANSKAWSGLLSDSDRLTWSNLAATLLKRDVFGNAKTLTGAQLYQSLARNAHTIGHTPLLDAPSDQAVSDLGGLTLAVVSSETSPLSGPGITCIPVNMPATGEYCVFTAAAPQPAGRAFIGKGKFRIIRVVPGTEFPASPLTPLDITAAYENKFGQLSPGMTVHVQINNINSVNMANGKPYPASILLT